MPTKTRTRGSKKKSTPQSNSTAPQIVAAKGGLTQSQLLSETLDMMEQENWISKKAGRDFVDSLQAVVMNALSEGEPVNLFGIVKLVPRYHTSGKRQVFKEFGNPESGRVTKNYKPKVTLKATVLKSAKDVLPGPAKMAKAVGR